MSAAVIETISKRYEVEDVYSGDVEINLNSSNYRFISFVNVKEVGDRGSIVMEHDRVVINKSHIVSIEFFETE